MSLNSGQKLKKILTAFLICGAFLFLLPAGNALAYHTPESYQKPVGGTLTAADWNSLMYDTYNDPTFQSAGRGDFVNTWMSASMNGPLGIGTTEPYTGYPLDVNGWMRVNNAIAGNAGLQLFGDPTSSSGIYIKTDGNVGIGLTELSAKLDLSGAGNYIKTFNILATGLGGAGDAIVMADNSGSLFSTSTTAFITPIITTSGGWTASGTTVYKTDNNGNVGIGTTSPLQKLDVAGALKLANATLASTDDTSGNSYLCDSTKTGTFRYDSVSGQSYLCDGKRWINQKNCGLMTDDAGQTYGTVQIGGQCWMTENINIGTMLATGMTEPTTTNNTIEKWCYSNNTNNCTLYGGLYNWNEAMRGSTVAGARGICPSGWHIPTDAEYNKLEKTVLGIIASPNTQYPCDFSVSGHRRCADNNGANSGGTYGVGKSLKAVAAGSVDGDGNDLVGFAGKLSGGRITGGAYVNLGGGLYLWSSSLSGSNVWYRYMYGSYSTINRSADAQTSGFAVRCVKNSEENQTVNLDSYGGTYINNFTINKDDASPNFSGSTLFTVLQTGNVGIGTTTPDTELVIRNSVNATDAFKVINSSNIGVFNVGSDFSGHGELMVRNSSGTIINNFSASGDNYINAGKVGIGTTTPSATLDLPTGSLRSLLATISGLGGAGNALVMTDDSGSLFSTSTAAFITPIITPIITTSGGWTASGTTVYKTDSNGNVGIGTTEPGTAKLAVIGGNVGIGTTAPGTIFESVETIDGNNASRFYYNNTTVNKGIILSNNDLTANTVSYFNFTFLDDSSVSRQVGGVKAGKEQLWTSTSSTRDSYMAFLTTLNGAVGEKMRITSDGNVGIGTTSPGAKLEVNGTIKSTDSTNGGGGYLSLGSGAGNKMTPNFFGLSEDTAYGMRFISQPVIASQVSYTTAGMVFETRRQGATTGLTSGIAFSFDNGYLNPKMVIDYQGNVGIGTTTPGAKLDLSGGANFVKTYNMQATGLGNAGSVVVMADNSGNLYTGPTAASSLLWSGSISGDIWNANSGNVGVGTTTPAYTMEVNGTFKVSTSSSSIILDSSGNITIGI